METDNKLSNQSYNSQITVQDSKPILNTAVVKAFARTGKQCTPEAIELITSEIIDCYSHLPIDTITQALKNGGRGKYGRTYLLSVQEVCIWIDSYLKDNPEPDIDNNKYTYYKILGDNHKTIRRVLKGVTIKETCHIIETEKLGVRIKHW